MPKDKSDIQCRYCKEYGHYKNECPKLLGRNNTNNLKGRPRLLGAKNTSPYKHTKTHIKQPVKTKDETIDMFPEPSWTISKPVTKVGWGTDKSFSEIVKTKNEIVEETEKCDVENDYTKLDIL